MKTRFEEFGAIQDIFLHKGKASKPYAFITFQEESAAKLYVPIRIESKSLLILPLKSF